MFFDGTTIQHDVQKQVSTTVGLLSNVVLPALATLVPIGVTAAFKWGQDHSGKRRSADLTERISALAKSISDLPEVSLSQGSLLPSPRAALTAELEATIRELTALQTKTQHRMADSLATTTAKLRSALLLYRPKGLAAWTLHLCFYTYSVFLVLVLIVMMQPLDTVDGTAKAATGAGSHAAAVATKATNGTVTSVFIFLAVFGILGIPPIVIRYYAAKIHRRQCAQALAGASPGAASAAAVCPEPMPNVSLSS